MAELTKEYFDQKIDKLAIKADLLATKADLKEEIEGLARMVADGFDDIQQRLDVRDRVATVEKKLVKIEEALHIKF
jgi:hypothetical protein